MPELPPTSGKPERIPMYKRRSWKFWVALWIVSVIAAPYVRGLVPAQYLGAVTIGAAVALFGFLMVILIQNTGAMARTVKSWRDQL